MRNKVQTTKKAIMNGFDYVIKVGYCGVQSLLNGINPSFCTVGVYGWNADIYQVIIRDKNNVLQNVAICTGNRPFGNIKPSYELVEDYEKRGQVALYEEGKNREEMAVLIEEFVQEAIAQAAL